MEVAHENDMARDGLPRIGDPHLTFAMFKSDGANRERAAGDRCQSSSAARVEGHERPGNRRVAVAGAADTRIRYGGAGNAGAAVPEIESVGRFSGLLQMKAACVALIGLLLLLTRS